MRCFICRTCGVQQAAASTPPERCPICEDERQYVGWQGQQWTTLEELRAEGYHSDVRPLEPDLFGIGTAPSLGIGQRALLVRGDGNVLWDCAGYLDQEAIDQVRELGGLAAISASHPHFYGCVVEWSQAFGGVPIYLPRADARWIMRPDPAVRLWEDRAEIVPGVALLQCGGHFEGSAVLHWAAGAEGRGALLVGDTIQVVRDRRFVSFMRSYPNLIPLPAAAVTRIAGILEPLAFDRVYGGWWDLAVRDGAADAVRASARRYVAWLQRMQAT